MEALNEQFAMPKYRLQILSLLCPFVAHPSFFDISDVVFRHSFIESLILSLELDNSSTVCAVGLSIVVKLMPMAAIKSYEKLRELIPRLFAILGRLLCWRTRPQRTTAGYSDLIDYPEEPAASELEKRDLDEETLDEEKRELKTLQPRESLGWNRLERSFDTLASAAPVPTHYFAFLHYLFPCNTVHFLRRPVTYLQERNVESPWTVGWADALDELQIQTLGTVRRYCYDE